MKYLGLLILCLLLLTTCKKKDKDSQVEPITKKYAQISTNPTDPLILKVVRQDAIEVSYFGAKEANGKPTSLDLVSILKPGESAPTLITYLNGKPENVSSPDGSSIKLIWLSEEEVRIIAITADGRAQVSVPFDLNDTNVKPKASSETPRQGTLTVRADPINRKTSKVNDHAVTMAASSIDVTVMKCNQPFDKAKVVMNYFDENNKSLGILYGSPLVNGTSRIRIPDPSEKMQFSDLCNTISSMLSNACYGESFFSSNQVAICLLLSSSIDAAIFGPTGEAIPLFTACETIINSFTLACNTLNASPGEGVESLLDNLCKYSEVAPDIPQSFTFRPIIYVDGEEPTLGDRITYTGGQASYPSIKVNLKGTAKLQNFATFPVDPEPDQDYTAEVNVFCAPSGALAKISVVGTDGYVDSKTIALQAGDSEITLDVPGADGGVQDRLMVEVQGVPSMYASIVF